MSLQRSVQSKPFVSSDAWAEIEMALQEDPNPSPDREVWSLIAEQERLRIRKILMHRLSLHGVSDVPA